jgi:hypothetical protein
MIEWRRVLSLLVKAHSVDWPTGVADEIVHCPAGREWTSARSGREPNSADPSARLWTISTEFLVEGGPDESTRFGGA